MQQITPFYEGAGMPGKLLKKLLRSKDLGWAEIGERFTRYRIVQCRWFNVYLHHLHAPEWHPECHDHPWSFVTILLWRGYLERTPDGDYVRKAGDILWRPATSTHNVITPFGPSWSIIITGPKSRQWSFKMCGSDV